MKKKLKIGITGGIGSGKSLISEYVNSKGYPVIFADEVAKKIMNENEEIKAAIIKEFGEEAYLNGELNKSYLSNTIFNDPENVKIINSIVHPAVIQEIKNLMYKYLEDNSIVFVESALIYEAKIHHIFDYVILVVANEDIRIKRILERDDVTVGDIKKRMESQWQDSAKQDKADFIVKNEDSIESLHKKIEFIITLLNKIV